uniref:Homolog of Odr-2 (Two) n=1 Tax=Elaeophora elaphi TaxID=1147741 RepID=A0A0R3RWL5_9BILA
MCLYSVTISLSVSLSLLLYIVINATTMLPNHTAIFVDHKSVDVRNLRFAKSFHLAYFDDFNIDISTNSNIYNRFHNSDTARCFSCMSRLYEAVWPALSSIYKKPKNFTDLCNGNTLDPKLVPFTFCPTICIRMWEEPIVAGVRIRGHIRGCLDDLLYNGFNQTIVTWYRWMHRDSCRQYRKRELFKLPTELSDDSYITVCTCYADYCNGRSSAATIEQGIFQSQLLLVLLYSLIILFPIQRISLLSV